MAEFTKGSLCTRQELALVCIRPLGKARQPNHRNSDQQRRAQVLFEQVFVLTHNSSTKCAWPSFCSS